MMGRARLLVSSSTTAPALFYLLNPFSRDTRPTGSLRLFNFAPGEIIERTRSNRQQPTIHKKIGARPIV